MPIFSANDVTTTDQESLNQSAVDDKSEVMRQLRDRIAELEGAQRMTDSGSVASFDVLGQNGNELNELFFGESGQNGRQNKTFFDYLEKQFNEKLAKMEAEFKEMKQLGMFTKLEAENKALKAELAHRELLTEHNELKAKVAKAVANSEKLSKINSEIFAKIEEESNLVKSLQKKIAVLEEKQKTERELVNELVVKNGKMEQKPQQEEKKEKMGKEKENDDFADQINQLRNDQTKLLERIGELEKRQQTQNFDQMKSELDGKIAVNEKLIGQLMEKAEILQEKCDRKSNDKTNGMPIFIRAFANNRFVSAGKCGTEPLAARADEAKDLEQFMMVNNDDGTVSLLSAENGKFVSANPFCGGKLVANRIWKFGWEKFIRIANSDGSVSFKAIANGKFVCADIDQSNGTLMANRTMINKWEKFKVISIL